MIFSSTTTSPKTSSLRAVVGIGRTCRKLLLGFCIAGVLLAGEPARIGWAQSAGAPAQTTWKRPRQTVEAPAPRRQDAVRQKSVQQVGYQSLSIPQAGAPTVPSPVQGSLGGHHLAIANDPAVITVPQDASDVRDFTADSSLPTEMMPIPLSDIPEQRATEESGFEEDRELFWWEQDLTKSLLRGRRPYWLTLEQALGLALTEAPELQILHSDWYIRQTEAERQIAAFDWTTFVDSIWNRDSTPVSSTLDGATRRLRSRSLSVAAGLRRVGEDGTNVELSQTMGLRNSNSQFISPNNQGTTRLGLDVEKPLLRGAGEEYNKSPYRLAVIDKDIAFDRFQAGVQDHLLQVSTAYWALVLQRGVFLQSLQSWNRAKKIADEMATRTEIDVTPVMLDRAKSEVASRLSESVEAEHDVLRAQDRLLRLIYGSRFTEFTDSEVLTMSLPMRQTDVVDPNDHVHIALQNRSEVHEAIRQIKAAAVRYDVAANELLPQLNLVLSSYVAGLRGDNDVGDSFLSQFSEGEPGVGVGLDFEIPYRNRAAKAAAEQTQVGILRMKAQLQLTLSEVTEDVRSQVIQRNKYGAVLKQRWETLARARRILDYSETRRAVLADGTQVADLYLENLLNQQTRLQNAETAYLDAQVRYTLSDNGLLRSTSRLDTLADRAAASGCEVCDGLIGGAATSEEIMLSDQPIPGDEVIMPIESGEIVGGHSFGGSGAPIAVDAGELSGSTLMPLQPSTSVPETPFGHSALP